MAIRRTSGNGQIEEDIRDLGFGSVVSRESRKRLLNRDGTFNVIRTGHSFWASLSPYHFLLTMSWAKFFFIVVVGYIGMNALFALAYICCGPDALSAPGMGMHISGFMQAFFFSVQTFATIGYGHISPVGMAANAIVTIESLVGLLGFALATGILFARFSRPTADILFSDQAIVAPYHGITAFEFRIVNKRKNQIIELEAKVLFSHFKDASKSVRSFDGLKLERSRVPFFPLAWTIVHPIDEESPLYGFTEEKLRDVEAEFLILLTGTDETFAQTVHTRSSYKAEEVVWHAKFADVFVRSETNEAVGINIGQLHAIDRLPSQPLLSGDSSPNDSMAIPQSSEPSDGKM